MTAPMLPRTADTAVAAAAEAARRHGVPWPAAAHIAASALRACGHVAVAELVEESAGIDCDPWTYPPARPAVPDALTARLRRTCIQAAANQHRADYGGDLRVLALAADCAAGRLDGAMAADVCDVARADAWSGVGGGAGT